MWQQIFAIAWAQARTTRNHLPRTGTGSWLMTLLTLIWYGSFAFLGWVINLLLSASPMSEINQWLGAGILGVCLFWQIVPLMTLTGGWSLNLTKLKSFPIQTAVLFGVEALLRITTAFEMVLIVLGAFVGLVRRPDVPLAAPFFVLCLIPLNLLIALGVREFILHSFQRNRMRELFGVVMVSIGLLPQILVRTPLGEKVQPYFIKFAQGAGTPWHEVARLSTGHTSTLSLLSLAFWMAAAFAFALWMFAKGLEDEESMRISDAGSRPEKNRSSIWVSVSGFPSRLFADPLGVLIEKEIRTLLRMPRFRVMFGMSCFFGIAVFFPLGGAKGGTSFMRSNFPEIVALYGTLILSDVLFWNIFGFDRSATQIYFVTPLELKQVFLAKNVAATLFVAAQNAMAYFFAIALKFPITPLSLLGAIFASAVVVIFFLSAGNLSSVTVPRAIDPTQTFRKQSSGQTQLWLLGCSLGMLALVGLGLLARWALDSEWALIGVCAVELGLGMIVFRVATDSAVARGMERREEIIDILSKGASQVAL